MPESHRLSKRRRIRLSEFAADPWVIFPSHYGPGMHSLILKSCAAAGFSPRVAQHVRQKQTTAGLVAGGIGGALMPNLFLGTSTPRGVLFAHLIGEGAPIPYELAMAYRKENVPDDFLATARATAQNFEKELSKLSAK